MTLQREVSQAHRRSNPLRINNLDAWTDAPHAALGGRQQSVGERSLPPSVVRVHGREQFEQLRLHLRPPAAVVGLPVVRRAERHDVPHPIRPLFCQRLHVVRLRPSLHRHDGAARQGLARLHGRAVAARLCGADDHGLVGVRIG